MRFSRKAQHVQVRLDAGEAGLLSALAADLLALLGDDDADGGAGEDADPLSALVGLSSGAVEAPRDPALARLLPDAYADDPQAAGEFRRFTEQDLRSGKRAHAGTVLATLAPHLERGGRLLLDRDEADAWLGTLNDLRLVLGTRLEVSEDTELDGDADDPRSSALQVYSWLGWLQESLLARLDPRGPG